MACGFTVVRPRRVNLSRPKATLRDKAGFRLIVNAALTRQSHRGRQARKPAAGGAGAPGQAGGRVMTMHRWLSSAMVQAGAAAVAGMLVAGAAFSAATPYLVSQAGQQFHPREVTIKRGETVQVVNDDGDLLHHVYVDSDKLQFDSGDQKPGTRTNIEFTNLGTFVVLCAIHPKMKLTLRVQ